MRVDMPGVVVRRSPLERPRRRDREADENVVRVAAAALRLSAEAGAPPRPMETLGSLWSWWQPCFLSRLTSARDFRQRVEDYLLPVAGALTEDTLTPDIIELQFARLEDTLSAGTLNHIRAHGRKIINDAIRARKWRTVNPFCAVRKRRVVKVAPYVLSLVEARTVIATSSEWVGTRWALLLGLGPRFGEMRHTRVGDFDDRNLRLTFRKTKTGVQRTVPVPTWLMPFLLRARELTKCEWLFPAEGGEHQLGSNSKPGKLLERALRRADVVSGYEHFCRKRGCGFSENHQDPGLRRCPNDRRALHCRGIPRHVRIHDLRHAFISLAQEAGCHPSVVGLLAGHSAKSITQSVYTHLSDAFIRTELEKLDLRPKQADLETIMTPRASKPNVPGSSPGWRKLNETLDSRASDSPRPLLTVSQVCERLQLGEDSVRSLIHKGKLRAIRWQKRFRVRPEDLDAFLSSSSTEHAP